MSLVLTAGTSQKMSSSQAEREKRKCTRTGRDTRETSVEGEGEGELTGDRAGSSIIQGWLSHTDLGKRAGLLESATGYVGQRGKHTHTMRLVTDSA